MLAILLNFKRMKPQLIVWNTMAQLYERQQNQPSLAQLGELRWNAKAMVYAGRSVSDLSPAELSALRWNDLAKTYERLGVSSMTSNLADHHAFRWNSLASVYAMRNVHPDSMSLDDIVVSRWNVLNRFPVKQILL